MKKEKRVMRKKPKRPDLRGCAVCGSRLWKKVSGFVMCSDCGHKYGDGGLGRTYSNEDGTRRIAGADNQFKVQKITRQGRLSYKKEI